MVNVTKEAAKKFNELIQKAENPSNVMLRISFGGYGWGGPKLQLTLDELKDNNDVIDESQEVKVVYSKDLQRYLKDAVIDYSSNWFSKGFTINGAGTSSC